MEDKLAQEQFFVTGALGCIGAWVVRELVLEGVPVAIFDLAGNPHRLRLILEDDQLERVQVITGDICEDAALERAVKETGATHIIHLAALQVPFCKATPVLGARVNVVGTVNIFEAAKRCGIRQVVYASSIAVYGMSEEYPDGLVDDTSQLHPRSLYGVYKQANEGTARIYWQDDGIASIGLRPYVVYGPGRDQGLTSGPTKAMLAAAAGQAYHIPFSGRCVYQYTRDVARVFIQAARTPFQGAEVFNMRGAVVPMETIVAAIQQAEASSAGRIMFADQPLSLPADVDDTRLRSVLGSLPETPLQEGVAETIRIFKQALRKGKISVQ
jgi:nucleoside-diphosphate-sugar epimerase